MSLDFSGQSLVGRSFKGENLANANFNGADIRSVNFDKADLSGATFYQARAGLSKQRQLFQILAFITCSIAIGMMSVLVGIFSATFFIPTNAATQSSTISGLLCLFSLTGMGLPMLSQGFTSRAFKNATIVCAIFMIGIGISTLANGSAASAASAYYSAGGITSALILAMANIVVLTSAGLMGGRWLIVLGVVSSAISTIKRYTDTYQLAVETVTRQNPETIAPYLANHLGMILVILEIAIAGAYVANQVIVKDKKFDLVKKVATTLITIGGTSFHRANLSDTNFTLATLQCSDLSKAIIERTNFYRAQRLYTSKLNGTILANDKVRQLAISKDGHQKNYKGINLKGINLIQADLTAANFTDSNLSNATLERAILTDANLTKTQAVGTNFQHAQFTGACIENWNIDSTTQLANIDCQYVYLQNGQQERRPSSGLFQPGEFTHLFQEVIDTIDLIFQNGVDWQALQTMLAEANQQLMGQSAGPQPPLTIRSVENKNDGAVVVRVDSPPDTDKADLHENLTDLYKSALKTIETSYQKQLQAKDEQIESYREQQAILNKILLERETARGQTLCDRPTATKLVRLQLSTQIANSFTHQITNLQIGEEGKLPFLDCTGSLPPSDIVFEHYGQWQDCYRRHLAVISGHNRIEAPDSQITNISIESIQQELRTLTQQVHHSFNQWLAADGFRPLYEKLLENLNPTDTIRIVLQTDNPQLWQLPWHSWKLLSRYPHSELTISTQHYQHRDRPHQPHDTIKILAILGSGDDLDLQADCQLLKTLPNSQLTVLSQPSRQALNNQLWDHPWDILFFAGHSASPNGEGRLRLNTTDSLTLPELRHALQRACQKGLQLAIFNSCDGLGLVHALSDLSLHQMIVMREAVPDQVAKVFLQGLLTAFAKGQSLPLAIRESREKLQGLEDQFPCATWLPVLCQTAATPPLTWERLKLG